MRSIADHRHLPDILRCGQFPQHKVGPIGAGDLDAGIFADIADAIVACVWPVRQPRVAHDRPIQIGCAYLAGLRTNAVT